MRQEWLGYKCHMEQRPLAIYLRNHEAAGQAGLDLFRRAAANQRNRPYAGELAELATEIEQDLESLRAIMRAAGVSPDRVQALALRLGERVGRLKPNGQLLGRAPLSDLIEVEGLLDAVRAKAAGWHALSCVPTPRWGDAADTESLYQRALGQAERLSAIHRQVAARVFTP